MYLMLQIERDLQATYTSLSSPNWSLIEKRHQADPYRNLKHCLTELADIQDTTDLNDDVSLVLALTYVPKAGGNCLRLSLVGKYACICDFGGRFLTHHALSEDPITQLIVDLLHSEGVVLLEPKHLIHEIHFGNKMASLYEVLFSSDKAIEWATI